MRKDRRNFLAKMGISTAGYAAYSTPFAAMINSMIMATARTAKAQSVGDPRRYIHFAQPGGFPRHVWDLFLTPYTNNFDTSNTGNTWIGTRYKETNGRYTGVEYATFSYAGVNLPWMWSYSVAAAGGGVRPMTDLANHMLQIRGINTGIDGHDNNRAMQHLPPGAHTSLTALSAERSSAPIPAVDLGAPSYVFKTTKPISPINPSQSGNYIERFLDPFRPTGGSTFLSRKDAVEASVRAATAAVAARYAAESPQSQAVESARLSAVDLADQLQNTNIDAVWDSLYTKYKDIVDRTLRPATPYPGLTDKPIGKLPQDRPEILNRDGTDYEYKEYNFYSSDYKVINEDIRETMAEVRNDRMAAQFALVEYIMTNNLSYSVSIGCRTLDDIVFDGKKFNRDTQTFETRTGIRSGFRWDQHGMGAMLQMLYNSLWGLSFSACLLELIDQLKAAGLFNDTVISVSSEFGSNTKNDGSGSDHGWRGQSICMYSGAVNTPLVLGNIMRTHSDRGHAGMWGYAGGVAALNGAQLDLGHFASTMSALLRVPSPITAKPSLVVESGSGVNPVIERAQQV